MHSLILNHTTKVHS